MAAKYILVMTMCASRSEGARIIGSLLRKRLVACANVSGRVESRFRWAGKLDKATESLVMMKSTLSNFTRIEREIRRLHSYEVPEIIALPIVAGSKDYLRWISDSVK